MDHLPLTSPRIFTDEADVPLVWQPGDRILDTYEVRRVLGGGLAYVYQVHHHPWGIDLAVKSPKLRGGSLSAGSVDYYVREAETWIKLGLFPHIVSCYFIRVLNGIPRIFMEWVDGPTLSEAIERGSLYTGDQLDVLSRLLDIAIQSAWGLGYAHQQGLVHQDMKPGNVLLAPDGTAKVTDFGMAQASQTLLSAGEQVANSRSSPAELTSPNDPSILVAATGLTPAYCSPEQAEGLPLTRRSDVWSWAVSILEVFLGGKNWKGGPQAPESLESYLRTGPLNPAIQPMPGELAGLLRQCFAVDSDARPHDMDVVATRLQEIYRRAIGRSYPRPLPCLETVLADTINNRAVSLIDLGQDREALKLLDEALEAETTHPAARYNRSLLLWRSGEITDEAALEELADNGQNQPGGGEWAHLLGLLHLERGDAAGAEEALRQAGDPAALEHIASAVHNLGSSAGRCLRVYPAGEGGLSSVAVTARGDRILSGGSDRLVRWWDAASGRCLHSLPGHQGRIQSVDLSPAGRLGLSGGWDGEIRLWDLVHGRCLQVFEGHTDVVQQVAFTPDGETALSASSDGTLRVWDLHGECKGLLEGHLDAVSAVAPFPRGRFAVSVSYDNTLRVWDLSTGRCLATFPWTRACTSNLSLSQDGRRLLLAGGDHQLWLVDLATGQPLRAFPGHRAAVKSVQLLPDGRQALSAGLDGTLRYWDLSSGRCLRTFTGHASAITAMASPAAGARLAVTASSDGDLRLWLLGRAGKAPYITVLPRSSHEIIALSSQVAARLREANEKSAQGEYSAALTLIDGLRLLPGHRQKPVLMEAWDRIGRQGLRTGLRSGWLGHQLAGSGGARALAFDAKTGYLLSAGEQGRLRLWDPGEGQGLPTWEAGRHTIHSLALASAPRLALSGAGDGSLCLWNLDTSRCLKVLSGHANSVNSVAITEDGRLGLSGSSDNTVRLWDLGRGRCLRVLTGHNHAVRAVAITPNIRYALSAGWDKQLYLWDLASGKLLHRFKGHGEVIDALALLPGGKTAVTGGLDGTLYFWDLESRTSLQALGGLSGYTRALAVTDDGQFIFRGDQYGSVQVWEVSSGRSLARLEGRAGSTHSLALSPCGGWLASAIGEEGILLWRLDWEYRF